MSKKQLKQRVMGVSRCGFERNGIAQEIPNNLLRFIKFDTGHIESVVIVHKETNRLRKSKFYEKRRELNEVNSLFCNFHSKKLPFRSGQLCTCELGFKGKIAEFHSLHSTMH